MTCSRCVKRFGAKATCVCGVPHLELLIEFLRAIDRAKAQRDAEKR